MLKKLKVTASVLAVSAIFLMPTAHAEQAAVMPVQEDENCIKAVMEFLGIDTEEGKFGLGGSLFRKNGFEVQDGRLYHYTDSQLDVYQSGFVQIEDGVYHVSEEGSAIDGPWADARVRRALCYAIDVDAINAAFLMGMAQMTDQWAVPGSATYNDSLNHFTYDPEKAKSLLAEAGYADGFTTNIITISGMSDMLTAIANMLDEVGIHCNIQQVDSATNNQYMKDGTWEGLMLHFATIAPDLGLYMGRHLDKNGAYYAKGIQHPDKEMELLEEIRRCMDPDEKHKLEKELQAAIYDAEDGSCLFGRVLYVNKSSMYKYDYVIDDHATEAFTACWDLSACWLNK